jgi:hypothetical protein
MELHGKIHPPTSLAPWKKPGAHGIGAWEKVRFQGKTSFRDTYSFIWSVKDKVLDIWNILRKFFS